MPLTQVQNGMLAGVIPASLGGTGTTAGVTGFKNRFINGDMTIDQRNNGASVTPLSGVTYTLDRWHINASQNSKVSVQRNAGSVTPPAGFTNYLGATSTSAYSVVSGDYTTVRQSIEGFNCADLGWGTANAKTITLSFWVRSSLTGTFGGSLNNSDYTRSYPFSYTISAANTWEFETITIPGDTSGTWATNDSTGINVGFQLGTGSTFTGPAGSWSSTVYLGTTGATNIIATNGATLYITGAQFEVGSSATNFDYLPYGTELQLCQRYFNIYRGGVYGGVQIVSSTFAFPLSVPVPMRTQPTFSTNMTDSRFAGATSPNSNQWAMYIQNSGWNTYSGSIDTLSLNGPAANSTQYNIGTYGVTLNSFTGFLLGGNIFFSFSAEL
jgi:hypothetical protein